MAYVVMTKEYQEYVIDDLNRFENIRRPLKASQIERLMTRNKSPFELHANPEDEFSMPEIGPNYEIVNNYAGQIRQRQNLNQPIMDDPLMIEKIAPEGYMLLNGHHRWLAAIKTGVEKVPVELVNLVHEDDIKEMLNRSASDKRAVFDLDEVLWIRDSEIGSVPEEDANGLLFEMKYWKRLRKYAPLLLQNLSLMGYDIWIYTAGYYSLEEIEDYFNHYQVPLTGIVNAARRKGRKSKKAAQSGLKSAIERKYKETLHIDTRHVLRIRPELGEFEYITMDPDETNWSVNVMNTIKKLPDTNEKTI